MGFGRVVALWVALIVLFVVFYNLFSATGDASVLQAWMPVMLVLLIVVAAVSYAVIRTRQWNVLNNRGVTLLNAGEAEQAEQSFKLAEKKGFAKLHRAVARYNQGIAALAGGNVETAAKLLEEVERSGGLKNFSAYHRPLPNHLAACHALRGDVVAARRWLELAIKRAAGDPVTFSLLPEMIVLCREGEYAAAAGVLKARWREADSLQGRTVKLLKVLEAFALSKMDPGSPAIAEALAATRPLDPRSSRMLTAAWPELRGFLEH